MAEIDNHVCGGGALVDLDDLAFELVTRTELHHFSPSQSPPFFSTAVWGHSISCDATGPQDGSSPHPGLTAGTLWRRDAAGPLSRPQPPLSPRSSTAPTHPHRHS